MRVRQLALCKWVECAVEQQQMPLSVVIIIIIIT
jgi:hypothetical protein